MTWTQTKWTIPMLKRAEDLYDVGLSFAAIAAVLQLDFERQVTETAVRHRIHVLLDRKGKPRRRQVRAPFGMAKPGAGRNWAETGPKAAVR